MTNPILHLTWSVQAASNMCASPLTTASLKNLEEDLTVYVRRMLLQTGGGTFKKSTQKGRHHHQNRINKDGAGDEHDTLVYDADISWIQLGTTTNNSHRNHRAVSSSSSAVPSSTPPPTPPLQSEHLCGQDTDDLYYHLHIQINVREHDDAAVAIATTTTPKAQLILCFCQGAPDKIYALAFVLVRGTNNHYIQTLFQWLESRTGIIISQHGFGFSPSQVALCLTCWISMIHHHHHHHQQLQGENGNRMMVDDDEDDASAVTCHTGATTTTTTKPLPLKRRNALKPLELTFAVPDVVSGKGLDSISLAIPPNSLLRLCGDIQASRRGGRQQHDHHQNYNSIMEDDKEDTIPILTALQEYILEVFHIDIRSFSLIRASSSSAAMLGCDGRCKILDEQFLPQVLNDIKTMIQNRYANFTTTTSTTNDIHIHDTNDKND